MSSSFRGGTPSLNREAQRQPPESPESAIRAGSLAINPEDVTPTPYRGPMPVNTPWFSLSCADAVAFLRRFREGSVDLVVTDPPYESLEKHRAVGTTTRLKHSHASSNPWFEIFHNCRFTELFEALYRVLAPNRHCYLFCDAETMFVAKPIAEQCGFKFWKPIVWDKKRIGMGYHYRARYEFILFFEKGKRKLNNLGISDIIEEPRIHNGYPTEKPSAVAQILIEQSTQVGEVIVDPFMGSGSSGAAALSAGRNFVGNDRYQKAVAIADTRLQTLGRESESDHIPLYDRSDEQLTFEI